MNFYYTVGAISELNYTWNFNMTGVTIQQPQAEYHGDAANNCGAEPFPNYV